MLSLKKDQFFGHPIMRYSTPLSLNNWEQELIAIHNRQHVECPLIITLTYISKLFVDLGSIRPSAANKLKVSLNLKWKVTYNISKANSPYIHLFISPLYKKHVTPQFDSPKVCVVLRRLI